jgi:Tol biopolymer transport system component
MYYHNESGAWTVKVSQRSSVTDPWPEGTTVSGLPNNIASPALSQDELTIVYNNPNAGGWDLCTATRTDRNSAFSNVHSLSELNTASIESSPCLSPDGLSLYFYSDRSGQGRLYESTRTSLSNPFGNPMLLTDIPYGYHWPSISADGQALYLGNFTTGDICVSYYVPEPGTIALLGLGFLALRKKH